MKANADVLIRRARSADDWRAIRDLCCLTGRQGDPIEPARWPFFAELWVAPYERLRPDWAYVAETAGRIVGYLTGCPDSGRFRRQRAIRSTLPLLLRVLMGRYPASPDASRFIQRTLGLSAEPERRLRREALPRDLDHTYPAHLHMNVDVSLRRRGVGQALVAAYASDLAARGVPGIHLICGAAPRSFYLRLGFDALGAIEVRPGVWIHGLGRQLAG
jgi:GNAT superfamily N-acetyltransferase